MSRDVSSRLRQSVWNGSIPLEIRLHKGDCRTYDDSDPYLIQFPRISYLGLLIHKLHAFFSSSLIFPDVAPSDTWLSYEGVPLKWHYPLGLLYDLYSGAEPAYPPDTSSPTHKPETAEEERQHLPWRLTVHFSDYPSEQLVRLDNEDNVLHDLFKNSVKEADYLRTGTGKTVMFLSKEDSTQLWDAVKQHDFTLYNPINQKLLNPQGVNLRNLPVRLYLPHAASDSPKEEASPGELEGSPKPSPHESFFAATANYRYGIKPNLADAFPQQTESTVGSSSATWCRTTIECQRGGIDPGHCVSGWLVAYRCGYDGMKGLLLLGCLDYVVNIPELRH
ncbi:Autophagy protein 5 [Neocucurbitaria cava]|uniref:Autophagy protein 5 n=1 Tax=Neocucurbitaria cava TaxID=798079 RepID=A0A9W8Y811_9PLEO|nr:Autophagy protein 5 [Neocucurbitaria cava]